MLNGVLNVKRKLKNPKIGLPAKGGIQRVVGEGKGGGRGNITLVTLGT
jgi:hypothetical protein